MEQQPVLCRLHGAPDESGRLLCLPRECLANHGFWRDQV